MTDMRAWATDLCTLLDMIEAHADDEDRVKAICYARFDVAEKHGLEIVRGGFMGDVHD